MPYIFKGVQIDPRFVDLKEYNSMINDKLLVLAKVFEEHVMPYVAKEVVLNPAYELQANRDPRAPNEKVSAYAKDYDNLSSGFISSVQNDFAAPVQNYGTTTNVAIDIPKMPVNRSKPVNYRALEEEREKARNLRLRGIKIPDIFPKSKLKYLVMAATIKSLFSREFIDEDLSLIYSQFDKLIRNAFKNKQINLEKVRKLKRELLGVRETIRANDIALQKAMTAYARTKADFDKSFSSARVANDEKYLKIEDDIAHIELDQSHTVRLSFFGGSYTGESNADTTEQQNYDYYTSLVIIEKQIAGAKASKAKLYEKMQRLVSDIGENRQQVNDIDSDFFSIMDSFIYNSVICENFMRGRFSRINSSKDFLKFVVLLGAQASESEFDTEKSVLGKIGEIEQFKWQNIKPDKNAYEIWEENKTAKPLKIGEPINDPQNFLYPILKSIQTNVLKLSALKKLHSKLNDDLRKSVTEKTFLVTKRQAATIFYNNLIAENNENTLNTLGDSSFEQENAAYYNLMTQEEKDIKNNMMNVEPKIQKLFKDIGEISRSMKKLRNEITKDMARRANMLENGTTSTSVAVYARKNSAYRAVEFSRQYQNNIRILTMQIKREDPKYIEYLIGENINNRPVVDYAVEDSELPFLDIRTPANNLPTRFTSDNHLHFDMGQGPLKPRMAKLKF